jgi:hypothetical protein
MSDSERKILEAALTAELAKARNSEGARNVLALLFPKAETVLRTFISPDSEPASRKIDRRISQRDFAENYFSLGVDTDAWNQSEFDIILKGSPADAFDQLHRKIAQASSTKHPDIRRIFLELLDSRFSSLQQLDQEWLDAIVAASPDLIIQRDDDGKFFAFDNEDRLRWIIIHGLKNLPALTQMSLLRSSFLNASDLSLLTDLSRTLIGDQEPKGTNRRPDWVDFGEQGSELRSILLGRVMMVARSGEIWNQARPRNLLWFWWGAGSEQDVKEFTTVAMNSPLGLRKLLEVPIGEVKSTAGNYEQVAKHWEKVVDLDGLRLRAEKIISESKDENDTRLATRFLQALQRGQDEPFS